MILSVHYLSCVLTVLDETDGYRLHDHLELRLEMICPGVLSLMRRYIVWLNSLYMCVCVVLWKQSIREPPRILEPSKHDRM